MTNVPMTRNSAAPTPTGDRSAHNAAASATLFVGTVLELAMQPEGGAGCSVMVSVNGEAREAAPAASCLLAPLVGDSVLVALHGQRAFVLSVLERTEPAKSQLELGNGVRLEVEGKKLSLSGADELELGATDRVGITTKDLRVRAETAAAVVKTVEFLGRSFESSFHRVRTFASQVDALADTFTATLKRSIRVISDIDQTRARMIDVRAEGTLTMHGENTVVTARSVTKIDSSQIQIG
jgi:Protein of unknown function (DUF3540)